MCAGLISMTMVGCTNRELIIDNESQLFTLEVGKGVDSRTYLKGNQLVWSEGDEIYVTSADGDVNGVLRLVAGENTPTGKFQGTVNGNTTKLKNIVYPAQINGMSMASADVNKLVAPMTGTIGGQQGNTLEFNCGFVKLNVLGLEDEDNVEISGGNIGATLRYDVASNSWVPSGNETDIEVVGAKNAEDFIVPVYAEKNQGSETALRVQIGENEPADVTVNIKQGDVEDIKYLYIIGGKLVDPSDEKTELPDNAVYVEDTEELKIAFNDNETTKNVIILGEGEFYLDARNNKPNEPHRETLTIMGSKKSKLRMGHLQDSYIDCNELIIKGCTILRRYDLKWSFLNLTGEGHNYTISDCYFEGSNVWKGQTVEYCQGIYINTAENCTYEIKNCTFDGDFGTEGAITVQCNENVNCKVIVKNCIFNNIPETSNEMFIIYQNAENSVWTLDTDVPSDHVVSEIRQW